MKKSRIGALLSGVRIIEFSRLVLGSFCAMMLTDQEAEMIRVGRPSAAHYPFDILARSPKSVILDMKRPEGVAIARDLVRSADSLDRTALTRLKFVGARKAYRSGSFGPIFQAIAPSRAKTHCGLVAQGASLD